jgi:hypothetical protein
MELLQLLIASGIVLITGTAVLLLLVGFFPRFATQGQAVVEQSPGRALAIGLVNSFFLGIVILTLLALGENVAQFFTLLALLVLGVLNIGVFLGLTGLVLLLGQRLWPDKPPVTRHSYAAALLLLAALAPFVGWFVLLPLLLIVALGLCVLVLIGRLQQGRILPTDMPNDPAV